MVLGMVPPNRFYGFRTPRTLASPEVWYPANRASGVFMIGAAVLSLLFNGILIVVFPDWPVRSHLQWMAAATVIPLLLSVIASLVYLRNLL
jgi:uncharacterized membrane protein